MVNTRRVWEAVVSRGPSTEYLIKTVAMRTSAFRTLQFCYLHKTYTFAKTNWQKR